MNKLLFFSALFFLFCSLVSGGNSESLGVAVGDSFKYSVKVVFETNDPTIQTPQWIEEAHEVDFFLMTITEISETHLSYNGTSHYENGTVQTSGAYHPLDYTFGFFIPINKSQGDILTTATNPIYINETIPRAYADSMRDTNHATFYSDFGAGGGVTYENALHDWYWDKLTGVLVEMSVHHIDQTAGYTTSLAVSYLIVNTNLWVVPEFLSFLILPVFMITTILTIIVYRIRRPEIHP